MTFKTRCSMKLHRVLPAAALAALCLLPGLGAAQQPTQPPALTQPIQQTPANIPPQTAVFKPGANTGVWVPRTSTFADLGFTEPVVLGYPDTIKEIYLPVPPGGNLNGATLQLNGSYVRADGGRTSLVYAIDGAPVQAFGYTADRGDASVTLPIDGRPRPSGYIKLHIDWRTAVALERAGKRPRVLAAGAAAPAPQPGADPTGNTNEPDIVIAGPGSSQQIG